MHAKKPSWEAVIKQGTNRVNLVIVAKAISDIEAVAKAVDYAELGIRNPGNGIRVHPC